MSSFEQKTNKKLIINKFKITLKVAKIIRVTFSLTASERISDKTGITLYLFIFEANFSLKVQIHRQNAN